MDHAQAQRLTIRLDRRRAPCVEQAIGRETGRALRMTRAVEAHREPWLVGNRRAPRVS
jgi:hypothetical protein